METLKTIKNIFIVLLALGVVFVLLGYLNSKKITQEAENKESIAFTSIKGVEIFIDQPVADSLVTSPLKITGKAPGNWFFEASAPVVITNWNGLIIGESYITAQGDWMTTDYVPFEGSVEFTNTEYGDYGFLILQKDNPSGESEFDDAIEFKVLFK